MHADIIKEVLLLVVIMGAFFTAALKKWLPD
jgi:hypothetical protein